MNKIIKTTITLIFIFFAFWLFCINHVSPNEIGIAYDRTNGKISVQQIGWHITAPYVKATTISDLPKAISLTSDNYNNVSSFGIYPPKFVQLRIKPEMVEDFFHDIGFKYLYQYEQETYMKYAYFQKNRPKWLEILNGE